MSAIAAAPKYKIGDNVVYRDHHNRTQTGMVKSIRADWLPWGNSVPLIVYSLEHPTYARQNHYGSEADIVSLSAT